MKWWMILSVGMFCGLAGGCVSDRPHEYGQQRPPVDQIDERDRGLQSKDVVSATDQLAQDLLSRPELNDSKTQWTIVVTGVENLTTDPRFNYDIFTERLRTNLAKYGHGRVALIENKDRLHDLQSRELESSSPNANAAGVQPDFALYGKIIEMPNRKTSYYLATFTLTNLKTRVQVWADDYEVKAER